jgi:iron(III) transport system permease protein
VARRLLARSSVGLRILFIACILILAVLIVAPVLFVLFAALSDVLPRPGNISITNVTLSTLVSVFNGATLNAAQNSILIAFGAALIALVSGGLLALLFARTDVPGRRFVYLAGLAPMFIPAFVAALSWSLLASPNSGLLNVLLRDFGIDPFLNVYSVPGLMFVLGVYYAPYVFVLVSSALALMSADMEEAAMTHGASLGTAVRRISLSLATPALLGSTFLVFILSLENFPVAQFLANPASIDTLPTYIYRYMSSSPQRGNEAAAVALLLVALVVLLTFLQQKALAGKDFTTVSGKGIRQKRLPLGPLRIPILIGVALYFSITVVLPLVGLIVTAAYSSPYIATITGILERGSFSLERFISPLTEPMILGAAANSTVVALCVAAAATVLAFTFTYIVYRTRLRGRSTLEFLSMVPLAVPAIVLGLGLLWTWLLIPLPIYGTLAVLVVAFLAVQMPQAYRGMAGSMLQVSKELEESAIVHGSSRPRAVLTITAPLMRTGIGSVFVLMLMLSMRELTVPLFLYNTNTRLLSIVIFDEYENGLMQSAAALGVWYCLLIGALALIARRLGVKDLA